MESEIKLETKLVGDIKGNFFVPSYQRGYRWSEIEAVRLLDDIYLTEGKRNYCLQPVVVRKNGERYELIDGQQRLTTIYLIYRFMNEESFGFIDEPRFTLSYETREQSEDFLKSIDLSRKDENIDFWFLCAAYESIKQWFSERDRKSTLTNINKYFDEIVRIIWYEVSESEDAIGLFTRLNIGKIPLTNAELVKAMFLSKDSDENVDKEKQEEIALQWDNMEKELHKSSLWYFLTNKSNAYFQTRIDLILDLISGKTIDNREKYYTFFKFDEMRKSKTLDSIWRSIQQTFLLLKDWHENHGLYHKIGYLIASETLSLQKIFELSKDKTKDDFKNSLDEYIRDSIKIKGNYSELSYEKPVDQKKILTLLLLFNVESVRRNGEHSQWFPFDKYKFGNSGKVTWSLEHIHAQHSEGLRTQEMWKEWLSLHIPSVEVVSDNSGELTDLMKAAIEKDKLERQEFDTIQQRVVELLSVKGNTEYMHSIANLALLSSTDNAVLNNSTFDVKRNEIIKMDKAGQYIPFCTRMVFLKYYTNSAENQLHFWGHADRVAYIEAMNTVLVNYLVDPIALEKEG
ncbi:hypothetical protein HMPREF9099_01021 [Lachnospiraceae bacterium oral taxon 082 str. F0431]|nr:hypothetical protein HMPREF9099_01021 [Lachnospiraceae bacterium oral taxon 082 str. F0431]